MSCLLYFSNAGPLHRLCWQSTMSTRTSKTCTDNSLMTTLATTSRADAAVLETSFCFCCCQWPITFKTVPFLVICKDPANVIQ